MAEVLDLVNKTLMEDAEFNNELEAWCLQRCSAFDEAEEHKLEYTDLHEQFCLLFEKKITIILENTGHSGKETSLDLGNMTLCRELICNLTPPFLLVTVEEFWQKLTKAADGDEGFSGEAFLLQCLAAIVDYDQFVCTMRGLKSSRTERK